MADNKRTLMTELLILRNGVTDRVRYVQALLLSLRTGIEANALSKTTMVELIDAIEKHLNEIEQ